MTSAAAAADKIYGRQDWSNITRPRRVEPDIAAYVAEVDGLLENPEEGIDEALLLNNIFGELAKKEASVMSDKTCSHVMEKLIRRATCRQARGILSGCAGYFAFLATNRYSSHVLQTLLHLIWPLMEQDEEGGEEGSAEGGEGGEGQGGEGGGEDGADGGDGPPPPSLKQLVLNICDELADTLGWSRAMTDISATHVLRSLLCVLAGREAVQDRRGKKAKHRQLDAHAFAESAGGMGDAAPHEAPREWTACLDSLVGDLTERPPAELQTLACHPSGGALLQMLLRILAAEQREGDDDRARGLIAAVLDWGDEGASAEASWLLMCDNTGSHFVEAVFETQHAGFRGLFFDRVLAGRLLEAVRHPVANFVAQALFQHADTKALAKKMFAEVGEDMGDLLRHNRLGVLSHLLGSCLRNGASQKAAVRAACAAVADQAARAAAESEGGLASKRGLAATLLGLKPKGAADGQGGKGKGKGGGGKGKGKGGGKGSTGGAEAGRKWGGRDADVPTGEQLVVDGLGAHVLQALLSFPLSLSAPALQSVGQLTKPEVMALMRDRVGSRCVVEPLLEDGSGLGAASSSAAAASAAPAPELKTVRRKLVAAMAGSVAALSTHPSGRFAVLKAFGASDVSAKVSLAEELLAAQQRLAGDNLGRQVLQSCLIEQFRDNRERWVRSFENAAAREGVLDDIMGVAEGASGGGSKKKKQQQQQKGQGGAQQDADEWGGFGDDDALGDDADDADAADDDDMDMILGAIAGTSASGAQRKRKRKSRSAKKAEAGGGGDGAAAASVAAAAAAATAAAVTASPPADDAAPADADAGEAAGQIKKRKRKRPKKKEAE